MNKNINLIRENENGSRNMSIDVLCVVQGLEFNHPNLEILEVYKNNDNFDALVKQNEKEFLIENIKVDSTSIYFESDELDDFEEKTSKVNSLSSKESFELYKKLEMEFDNHFEQVIERLIDVGKFADIKNLNFANNQRPNVYKK